MLSGRHEELIHCCCHVVDAGYSSLVGQFLRAAVATPASPSPGSLGDHYKEMLAAGQLQSYWQAMTQAMTQAPGDAEGESKRRLEMTLKLIVYYL